MLPYVICSVTAAPPSATLFAWGRARGSFPRPLKAEEERAYLGTLGPGRSGSPQQAGGAQSPPGLHILKKYYVQASDQDDLISIGTIGLIKGITTFQPDKKVRLATYASRCIENAILLQRNKRQLRWKTMNLLGQNGLCSAA
ncbi:MAG: sigma factor [Evtepia sp.]